MLEFRRFFRVSRPLLLLLPLFLAACVGDIDPFFSFNFERHSSATIPASPTGIDTTFGLNIQDTSDEFQKQGTSRDLLESAIVTKLGVVSDQLLNTLDSIEYFVVADTLPRLNIATLRNLPNAVEFATDPADTNLVRYFKQPSFTLEMHVMSSKPIATDMQLTFEQMFYLVAQPR